MASSSTAKVGEIQSERSSRDVSPIEDFHRPQQDQFQVHGQLSTKIMAPNKIETSHQSIALLAEPRARRTFSPHWSSSTTTSRLREGVSRTGTSGKANDPGSTIHGVSDINSAPRHMRDAVRAHGTLANQHKGQEYDCDDIWTDARGQNKTTRPLPGKHPSQEVLPLYPNGNKITQAGLDQQTVSTGSPGRNYKFTTQTGRRQTQMNPGFDKLITAAEGFKYLRDSPPEIERPTALASSSRNGFCQPRNSDDERSKTSGSGLWPAAKMDNTTKKKALVAVARVGLNDPKWTSCHVGTQLRSRFSDTSCSTVANDSPPSTPELNFERRVATPASSILSRKKPVQIAGMRSPNVPQRKPTPSEVQISMGLTNKNEGISKPLPKSPPEAQAVTRVASLEAKLETLRRRRANLQTVIQELTSVAQRSPITYDMASRQKMKQTVDGLGKELSEVGREEHETGLQLHRAWKREEQTSSYENSFLWVKRLAS